jgi:hypothetical protein
MVDYDYAVLQRRIMMGSVNHSVTVRNINGRFHCRVFVNGELNSEGVTKRKDHIGAVCRDLLRWEDKCGNISDYADRARHRQKNW